MNLWTSGVIFPPFSAFLPLFLFSHFLPFAQEVQSNRAVGGARDVQRSLLDVILVPNALGTFKPWRLRLARRSLAGSICRVAPGCLSWLRHLAGRSRPGPPPRPGVQAVPAHWPRLYNKKHNFYWDICFINKTPLENSPFHLFVEFGDVGMITWNDQDSLAHPLTSLSLSLSCSLCPSLIAELLPYILLTPTQRSSRWFLLYYRPQKNWLHSSLERLSICQTCVDSNMAADPELHSFVADST